MRESQSYIMRLDSTKFGVLPEYFNLEEIKFNYTDQQIEEFIKN